MSDKETILNSPEDMRWLWETHLKEFPHIRLGRFEYRSASIFGNEDCPSRIELYRKLEPSYRNKPSVVFERDVMKVANKMGCYDAADHISSLMTRKI